MPYTGPSVTCKRCGASFSRLSSLKRHRAERRCPGRGGQSRAIVPARPKPIRAAKSEIIDVVPTRSEIVPARPRPARPGPVLVASRDGPPAWWEPQAEREWRQKVWAEFPADYRDSLLARRAGSAFTIRPPDAAGRTILWSQYYALKALATRLDAGIATERERVSFEAGLREYDANYDRIRAERKALPG